MIQALEYMLLVNNHEITPELKRDLIELIKEYDGIKDDLEYHKSELEDEKGYNEDYRGQLRQIEEVATAKYDTLKEAKDALEEIYRLT